MNKRIFNYLKCSIKKIYALSMFCFLSVNLNGQIVDMNVLNAQAAYANALREMSLRAAEIRREVHPQRELMYQKYKDGYYRDVVEICLGVIDKYIYYKYDNKAISDMEVLAGDCAVKISAYDTAIYLYKTAKEAGEGNLDQKLLQIFNQKMSDANTSYINKNYSTLKDDVDIALKTGYDNGKCYYFYGVYYEYCNDFVTAKKMYKIAKKKQYLPAKDALKELKKKTNN